MIMGHGKSARVTEVPGKVDFDVRVLANAALIERFVRDTLARDPSAFAPVRTVPATTP
jgi:hypothetical protein